MEKKRGRSEGVQVRLDPDLKQEAKTYLAMTDRTWQELLEQYVQDFVATCRTQMAGQQYSMGTPFRFIPTGDPHSS
jgi:hypothetical protein